MTFARAKPGGATDDISVITANEFDTVDVNQSRALDGTAGGPYSPTSPIGIGNAGLRLDDNNNLLLSSRTVNRRQTLAGFSANLANWVQRPGGVWRNLATTGAEFDIFLDIPNGATLDSVTVRFQGGTGHTIDPVDGGSGIIMPFLQVITIDQDGAEAVLGSASTPGGQTPAAYQATHDRTVSGLAAVIDRTDGASGFHYVLRIRSEQGTDFQPNADVFAVWCAFTMTSMTEY